MHTYTYTYIYIYISGTLTCEPLRCQEAMFMFTRPLSGTLTTCLTQSHRRGPVEGVGARSAIVWQPLRPETCRGY